MALSPILTREAVHGTFLGLLGYLECLGAIGECVTWAQPRSVGLDWGPVRGGCAFLKIILRLAALRLLWGTLPAVLL